MNCKRLIDSARPVCGASHALSVGPLTGVVFWWLCHTTAQPTRGTCARPIDHASLASAVAIGYVVQAAAAWDHKEMAKWARKAVAYWRANSVECCE